MPDTRHHRGPHPHDPDLFGADQLAALREAVVHLSWLLSRGYAWKSALKLVGDRFSLTERQRTAVLRSACGDDALAHRRQSCISSSELAGRTVVIDGFNLLTTIEAALGRGVVLIGRDGCYRDMASMHGSYRKVDETVHALTLIGRALDELQVAGCEWFLDSPVSNSGRLRGIMQETAANHGWNWTINLVPDPDQVLPGMDGVVVSADSAVMDQSSCWVNLAQRVVDKFVAEAWLVDLRKCQ